MHVRLSSACVYFFFKQKTAYEMRISDWSSDVCSSDIFFIVLAEDHILDVRPAGCQNLLLDSAHGQYLATQRDFTGHGQVWLHFPLCKGRSQRCEHGEIGRASCRERVCQYV